MDGSVDPWVLSRLRDLLPVAGDDVSLASLWPVISQWFAAPLPGARAEGDIVSLECGRSSGEADLDVGIENPAPESLTGAATWFYVTALRRASRGAEPSAEVGIELWFAEDQDFIELTRHGGWDTGNLIGFDLIGNAGDRSTFVLDSDIAASIRTACARKRPAYCTAKTSSACALSFRLSTGGGSPPH